MFKQIWNPNSNTLPPPPKHTHLKTPYSFASWHHFNENKNLDCGYCSLSQNADTNLSKIVELSVIQLKIFLPFPSLPLFLLQSPYPTFYSYRFFPLSIFLFHTSLHLSFYHSFLHSVQDYLSNFHTTSLSSVSPFSIFTFYHLFPSISNLYYSFLLHLHSLSPLSHLYYLSTSHTFTLSPTLSLIPWCPLPAWANKSDFVCLFEQFESTAHNLSTNQSVLKITKFAKKYFLKKL